MNREEKGIKTEPGLHGLPEDLAAFVKRYPAIPIGLAARLCERAFRRGFEHGVAAELTRSVIEGDEGDGMEPAAHRLRTEYSEALSPMVNWDDDPVSIDPSMRAIERLIIECRADIEAADGR